MKRIQKVFLILLVFSLMLSGTVSTAAAEFETTEIAEEVTEASESVGTPENEPAFEAADIREENQTDIEKTEESVADTGETIAETEAVLTESEDDSMETEGNIVETEEEISIEVDPSAVTASQIGVPLPCNPVPDVETSWERKMYVSSTYKVTMSWTKVAGADSYRIYRKGSKETEWTRLPDSVWCISDPYSAGKNDPSYCVAYEQVFVTTYVPWGDWYTYVCCAVKDGVEGGYDPNGFCVASYYAPITGKASMYNCSTGVKLEWKANSQVEGYKIYRREVNIQKNKVISEWKGIAWIKDSSRSGWVDKTAEHGHQYEYAIRSYAPLAGKTKHSALINFKNAYETDALNYVQRLQFSSGEAIGNRKIRLSWCYPAQPASAGGVQSLYPEITYCADPDFNGKIYKVDGTDMTLNRDDSHMFLPITAEITLPSTGTYYFRIRSLYYSYDVWKIPYNFKSGRSDNLKLVVK